MHVVVCPVQDAHVHALAHLVGIERAVAVGDNEAFGSHGRASDKVRIEVLGDLLADVPHLKEHKGEAPHRFALQHDRDVLPVPELFHVVDVFVGHVHTAGEGDFPIHYQDLAVVAVIVVGGKHGGDRRELPALDTQAFHQLGIGVGQGGERAGSVVHYADFNTLLDFAGENFQHRAPHQAFFDDEVFQEDEALGVFQLTQYLVPLVFASGEIFDRGVAVDGVAGAVVHVAGERCRIFVAFPQGLPGCFVLRQLVDRFICDDRDPFHKGPVPQLALSEQVQKRAWDGCDHDGDQPGYLGGGIHARVDQVQDHDHADDQVQTEEVHGRLHEQVEDRDHDEDLDCQQSDEQSHATGQKGPDYALLAPFQQTDAACAQ